MHHENQQEPDFHDGKQRIAFERVGVLIEGIRSEEHHQVSGDMNDQIEEKSQAGYADKNLGPDRGRKHAQT